ncbi:DUF1656 domain-containing protein [Acetobacteraceae bacterium]|nr:DUF1656 domain-containing protein [Acetobacteraceae bacterium]
MMAEFNLFGIYIAPITVYGLIAVFLTVLLRTILWRIGILQWFWHVALFEVALFCCILSLLILYL